VSARKDTLVPEAALVRFIRDWYALPPLVRAGLAADVAAMSLDRRERHAAMAGNIAALGMGRRADVARRFAAGADAIGELMTALAIDADDEAVASGVDALVTGGEP